MSDLDRQIEREGIDWLATVVWIAIILSLVFAATFFHAKASRAQAVDPMPVLIHEALWLPAVAR